LNIFIVICNELVAGQHRLQATGYSCHTCHTPHAKFKPPLYPTNCAGMAEGLIVYFRFLCHYCPTLLPLYYSHSQLLLRFCCCGYLNVVLFAFCI